MIAVGSRPISKIMLGSAPIQRVYQGSNLVWEAYTWDSDAVARILQIETAGAIVSDSQARTLNEFIISEKLASRWTSHKRLYLPVWSVASANAICLKTGAVGTWVGGVTHSDGFVKGDGSTGYLNMNATYGAMGLGSNASGYQAALVKAASGSGSRYLMGCGVSTAARLFGRSNGPILTGGWSDNASSGSASETGIASFSLLSGVTSIWQRSSASRSLISTAATFGVGGTAAGNVLGLTRSNTNGTTPTPVQFTNAEIGALVLGLGLSDADDSAFTANLKTLWETTTGLTLP